MRILKAFPHQRIALTIATLGTVLTVFALPAQASSSPAVVTDPQVSARRSPTPSRQAMTNLVWSDEFNAATGTAIDSRKWAYETGGNGWGNNELQYYTNRKSNVAQDGRGNLAITARKEWYGGRSYTSARIFTKGKYEFRYGRMEARIKIPGGQGIWPAFWALGNNAWTDGWPQCGEIDMMENVGNEPYRIHGTVHGSTTSGGHWSNGRTKDSSQPLRNAYHTYAAEWTADSVKFLLDGQVYHTVSRWNLASGQQWVFARQYYMLLNVAVGGNWPGSPNSSTVLPQQMLVDYVRVYK